MRVVVIGVTDDPADAERLQREGADAVEPPDGRPTLDTPEEVAAAIVRGATTVRTRYVRSARRVADVLAAVADAGAAEPDNGAGSGG
jgi:hypothetical protein